MLLLNALQCNNFNLKENYKQAYWKHKDKGLSSWVYKKMVSTVSANHELV